MATNADNQQGGPFERAMAREEAYRQHRSRASLMGFPSAIFRTFRWVALGFIVAWGGLLIVHWSFLSDPRWLAVLHTMVYGLGCLYFVAVLILFTLMQKKPEAFGFVDE